MPFDQRRQIFDQKPANLPAAKLTFCPEPLCYCKNFRWPHKARNVSNSVLVFGHIFLQTSYPMVSISHPLKTLNAISNTEIQNTAQSIKSSTEIQNTGQSIKSSTELENTGQTIKLYTKIQNTPPSIKSSTEIQDTAQSIIISSTRERT